MKIENKVHHLFKDPGCFKINAPWFILADRNYFEESIKFEGLIIYDCDEIAASLSLIYIGYMHKSPFIRKLEELRKFVFLEFFDNYIAGYKTSPESEETNNTHVKIIGKPTVPWLITYTKGSSLIINYAGETFNDALNNPAPYFPEGILENDDFSVMVDNDEGWRICNPPYEQS